MLQEIVKPTSESYNINIPKEYINTEVEILVLPFTNIQNVIDNEQSDIQAFSNNSANNIEDWLDESEDEVWK